MSIQETPPTKERKTFNPLRSVTGKFIIALAIILLIVAIIQIWYNTTSIREQVQLEAELLLETDFEVYEARVQSEAKLAQALAVSLADRSDLQELYLAGDREALYDFLRPMFEQMVEYQVQHLYVHNPDGTVFLRVHNRDRFGDDATYRPTLADSLNNKIITGGIDIGPNRIGTRAVAPMYDERSNFIGLLEVGIDYDITFFSELKELSQADFTAWITYEAAAAAGLAPTEGSPDSPINQLFYYSGTAPGLISIPSEVYTSVLQNGQAASSVYTGTDGAPYITYLVPLKGYQDQLIGLLEISEPYAQVEANLNAITLTNIAITLALILGAMTIIGFFTSQVVLRPLTELTRFVELQEQGQLKARANVHSSDEFEQLSNSFNSLADSLTVERETMAQRVADRTQALATSAEISRRLSTIVEQDELVSEVVEQLKSGFNYYHAHIYLLSESGDRLLMAGGTGEAGKLLLEREHSIMIGRGLVGRVAESKETLLVPNTRLDSDWLPNPLLPDTQSEIAVPIMIGEQVLGVLDVQNDTADSLTQQDADLIRAVADQVGIALQNISSAEAITKRAAELQAVAAISTSISTIQNVEEMLQSVVHLTQRRFGLYHAHVFLYEEDADQLAIVACGYKEGDEHEGTHGTTTIPLSQEQSLVARAARTREPVIVNDVRSDPGWLPNPLLPDTAAELAVPMIVGDQLLGVLDVQAEHTDAFTQEDASIQTTLASQVAIAVQNARSFAQTRQQAERESILNTLTQKIQNTTSIAEALQITARELGHALGKKPTLVSLDAPSKAPKQEESAS
jgi:GAF domain-containing protein/HAMP domain-containing protein